MTLEAFLKVWCRRGSQGMEASWLKPDERNPPRQLAESFAERDERHARERYEEATGKRSRTVIDITPSTELLERLQ